MGVQDDFPPGQQPLNQTAQYPQHGFPQQTPNMGMQPQTYQPPAQQRAFSNQPMGLQLPISNSQAQQSIQIIDQRLKSCFSCVECGGVAFIILGLVGMAVDVMLLSAVDDRDYDKNVKIALKVIFGLDLFAILLLIYNCCKIFSIRQEMSAALARRIKILFYVIVFFNCLNLYIDYSVSIVIGLMLWLISNLQTIEKCLVERRNILEGNNALSKV